MKIVKASMLLAMIASVPMAADAESARLRLWLKDGSVRTKEIELERVTDKQCLFRLEKEQITDEIEKIDVIPEFMVAKKGDAGFWVNARGSWGRFDQDAGAFSNWRSVMPIFGLKKGASLWYAHVKTWRFDYRFCVETKNGVYEAFPRFECNQAREYFPVYQDIVLAFHRLDGADADYNGLARAYQKQQIDKGIVRPVKERFSEQPCLRYAAESFVVRIMSHCSKVQAEKGTYYTKQNEQPLVVHMPFGVAEEFVQAIHDAGVDKATILSAGWTSGGYDGRYPDHFPVEIAAGGEAGFRKFIGRVKKLGYQFSVEADNTEAYQVAEKWSDAIVCKRANGTWPDAGLWAGGTAYQLCAKAAWTAWLPEEIKRIKDLGTDGPHYIDVFSATYPWRCADPHHPCTPEQMASVQNEILSYAKKVCGGAASESGYDHVIGNIDYCNYVERDLKSFREGTASNLVSGVWPLWELVYHGIVFSNPDRLTQNHTRGKSVHKVENSGDPRWMEGDGVEDPWVALKLVEFGGRPIFYTYKFADVPRIKKAFDEYKPFRHLQKERMSGHREVAANVFETTYADGSLTVCNYNQTEVAHKGVRIGPMNCARADPDGKWNTNLFKN